MVKILFFASFVSMVHWYGFDALLVTSSFEFGSEEFVHDAACHIIVNESSRHYEYVGIVVLAYEMCNLWYPAEAGTYGLMLVERHADTFTAAAHSYAWIDFAIFDSFCKFVAELGIVAALFCVCAVVLVRYALFVEILLDKLLELKRCVVTGQSYCLDFHNYCCVG